MNCEHCSAPFEAQNRPGHVKRFCSERCRKRAEGRRAQLRKRAAQPLRVPRLRATSCKDCGTTEGMGWWVGRMKHPGSAGPRCHSCYLASIRRRQTPQHGGVRVNKVAIPKPTEPCDDCGAPKRRGLHARRCRECSLAYRAKLKGEAQARRRRAELAGDRSIHWHKLGERDSWKCHLCGGTVRREAGGANSPNGATVDHLVPIAAGGSHEWENVALAHRHCNISRGASGSVQLRLVS